MITEDYVSFEIAKLLKEKEFDGYCWSWYHNGNHTYTGTSRFCNSELQKYEYSKPTLQMAMKWLREVHNIGIFPSTYTITNSKGSKEEHVYGSAIVNLITFDLMCDDIMPRNSYEEACEAAIKYCLENLI